MNLLPNFEHYRKDQEKLEKIPTIKPDFHYTINDSATKILSGRPLNDDTIAELEIVYNLTQDLEKNIITMFDEYRSTDTITKNEFLIITTFFLTANQNGPQSMELKDSLMKCDFIPEDFEIFSKKISIPESTRQILINVYKKIFDSKKESTG
jgi:hypothetical protein